MERFILVAKNQYTGLIDKNGKEIYESDIVRVTGRDTIYTVVYHTGCFKLANTLYPNSNLHLLEDVYGWVEIIGNIYESEGEAK
jgi:hypothetical protein